MHFKKNVEIEKNIAQWCNYVFILLVILFNTEIKIKKSTYKISSVNDLKDACCLLPIAWCYGCDSYNFFLLHFIKVFVSIGFIYEAADLVFHSSM